MNSLTFRERQPLGFSRGREIPCPCGRRARPKASLRMTAREFSRCIWWLTGVVALALSVLSLPAFSQTSNGRILGTVTDETGGVVAGATVTVIDVARGVTRTLTTDDAGQYSAPNLTPGTYTVTADAKGFKKLEHPNIQLQVGQEQRVDLTLQPGEQQQTVTVTEAPPLVETTNATLGGTLNNADITDMPLNGRNYQNLLSLRPGITVQPGGGPWTQSSNGVRPDESDWMVDGVINANFYDARPIANMPSAFTDGATILPIDSIQEFNLEENPKAEYGWKPGAVVNVGLRSGTNSLHGSAYAFGRSEIWDARNAFNPAPVNGTCFAAVPAECDKLPTTLKQFGAVVSGPIKKDKLFFMGGYEGLRSEVGNAIVTGGTPETAAQPTPDPKHSMVDAISALQAGGTAISPVSLALSGCSLTPAVACTGGFWPNSPNSTRFTSTFPNTNQSDNGIGKLDYHINDKNTLYGFLMIGYYNALGEDHPFMNPIFEDYLPIKTYTGSGNWDYTATSSLLNEVRFAYNKAEFFFYGADATKLANGVDLPINTGLTLAGAPGGPGGMPNINISGFQSLGTWHNRPFYFKNPYYDGQDSVSYLIGKHSFKFGAEIAHIQVNNASYETARGRLDFKGGGCLGGASTPLEDFFCGAPTDGFSLVGDPTRMSVWNSYAGFAQDDWRVTPKLTVNLGLRYSYVTPPSEQHQLFGNFIPGQGLVQQAPGAGLWGPDHKDFSPRLGFAWDLTGKGTTVVRGGYSLMYSTFTIATLLQETNFQNSTAVSIAAVPTGACSVTVPVGETCTQAGGTTLAPGGTLTLAATKIPASALHYNGPGPVFPTGVTVSCTSTSPCNVMAVDPNLKTPYIQSWNLGVTHAFTNNLSFEVEYVGTHGSRLTGFRDLNQPLPDGTLPIANQFPTENYLGFINFFSNDTISNYEGMQATLTKRLSHGLSFVAGYTYSHDLDNGSLNRNGFLPQNSASPMADYASGDFDMRHRFTFTTTYQIPGTKGHGQLLEGWKLNAIISIQSGQPWTVWDTTNNFSSGAGANGLNPGDNTNRWDFFGNPSDFKSQGANSIPYCTGPANCTVTSGVTGASVASPNPGTMWSDCMAHAADPSPGGTLATFGCFVAGNSVMTPPAIGNFGNMGRNLFRDTGFHNVDFSIFKDFTLKERYTAEFRVEFFNIFNHPEYANPYGSVAGYNVGDDPGGNPSNFGCGCATPDVMAGNPLVGSGSNRVMQLGLKLNF